jgi:hypothetical protein
MLIQQAEKLRNNDIVYDILQREYRIIGYKFKYDDGKLSDMFFELQNSEGLRFPNTNYRYLYTSLEELSDPELAFAEFVQIKKTSYLPIDLMQLEQLNDVFESCRYGFYKGYEAGQHHAK